MLNESNKAGLIILASILFGIYCFVFGQSGILERMHLHSVKDSIDSQIEHLESENEALFSRYLKYKSGKFLKYESEQAGYIQDSELVLVFPPPDKSHSPEDISPKTTILEQENEKSQTKQLRILWIILSIIIIFLYIIKNQVSHKDQDT